MDKAFTAYQSWLTLIECLNEAERGRLFAAALQYGTSGEEAELKGNERIVWATIRSDIDQDRPLPNAAKKKPVRFVKPTVDEIAEYCEKRKNGIDAQHFFDFYESKGWKIGKDPMHDWQASVRTWEKRDQQKPKCGGTTNPFRQMLRDEERQNGQG